MEKGKPTFGSLFAGVGGFDLGMEDAGWECLFQVEWDKNCQQTLQHHWPDVPKWGDVCDVNGADLPPVDCITFGSPCQDLSVAGKRAGLDGGRSSMFYEATRIIREMRDATGNTFPRCAIWENVPGAFSSRNGDDFAAVITTLGDIGANHIEWSVLDAQFFGVPQRRRRVFVVAVFNTSTSFKSGQQILTVAEGGRRNNSTRNKQGQDAAYQTDGSVTADSEQIELFGESSHAAYASGFGTLRASSGTVGGGQRDVENRTIGALCAADAKHINNQYVNQGKLIVQ